MNIPRTSRLRGDFWAVVSACSTGGGLVAAKAALRTITPITFNTYVFFLGSVIILIDALISRTVRDTVCISPAKIAFLFLISVLFTGSTFLLFSAVSLTEPATVSFLSRLELVATLIVAAIFLKERIRLSETAGLILVAAGIIVMRYGASVELSRAVTMLVAASVLMGSSEVLVKSRIDWINYRSFIFYRGLFMTIIYLVIGRITDQFIWVTDTRLLVILCICGLFLPYMGRLGYLKAMKHINISRAAIIVQSQPFFAGIGALIILGTLPGLKEIVGGLLIVAGVITIKLIERHSFRKRAIAGPTV